MKTMVNIYLLYTVFHNRGYLKLTNRAGNAANPIADSSTDLLQNFTLPISKIPNKIKQNPNSPPPNHLSYPISSNPTKIKHFPSFITQKSNPHPTKNLPTIPKSSLFVDTFTDNVFFTSKSPKSSLTTSPTQGGYSKTTHKITPIRE